jgi:hypothetical protein
MLLSMVMHAWCLLLYWHCMLVVVFFFGTAWYFSISSLVGRREEEKRWVPQEIAAATFWGKRHV